jgi:hypothetical protein
MTSKTIYHYVYRITNLVEKKHYYGKRSSKCDPREDLGKKYFSSSKDRTFIKDQKLNPQNYKYKIVSKFLTDELACLREIKLHSKFNVALSPNFYNKSRQTSTKFCYSNLGLIRTKEFCEKISKANKGRKHSKEHIEKWKISMVGKTNKGKPMSSEQKIKISEAHKGKPKAPEHIENMSGESHHSFTGYYVSPELISTTMAEQKVFGIFAGWYSNLDKPMSRTSYSHSKYLKSKWTWEELENKTFRDLGFNFIQKC